MASCAPICNCRKPARVYNRPKSKLTHCRDAPRQAHVRIYNMDRVPPEAVKDPPNLVRTGSFSLDRLLSHIDPGPAEESEAFVRLIYEQRRTDVPTERNGKIGR